MAGLLFAFYNGADAKTSGVPRRNARSTVNDRRHASPTEVEQQERAARDAVGVGAIRHTSTKNSRKRAADSHLSTDSNANSNSNDALSSTRSRANHGKRPVTTQRSAINSRTAQEAGPSPTTGLNNSSLFNSEQSAEIRRMFLSYLSEQSRNNQTPAAGTRVPVSEEEEEEEQAFSSKPAWNASPDRIARGFQASASYSRTPRAAPEAGTTQEAEFNSNIRVFPFGNIGLNATNVPPTPESVLKKIRQGEFVHLDHLLPGVAASGDNFTITFEPDKTTPGTSVKS